MSAPLHLEVARARALESGRLGAFADVGATRGEPRRPRALPRLAVWRERRAERHRRG